MIVTSSFWRLRRLSVFNDRSEPRQRIRLLRSEFLIPHRLYCLDNHIRCQTTEQRRQPREQEHRPQVLVPHAVDERAHFLLALRSGGIHLPPTPALRSMASIAERDRYCPHTYRIASSFSFSRRSMLTLLRDVTIVAALVAQRHAAVYFVDDAPHSPLNFTGPVALIL
jgi:hypothetical protein